MAHGKNKLKALIATTTIIQGINFPASSILLPSYNLSSKQGDRSSWKQMSAINFLNIADRAHQSMGLVGIATKGTDDELEKVKEFLNRGVSDIISSLYSLCNNNDADMQLDLRVYANQPEWSNFIQYLAHMYNQSSSLDDFTLRAETILRNTYGYTQMDRQTKSHLLEAVKEYGSELDGNRELSLMSDHTGFSPHTLKLTTQDIKNQNIVLDESLFSGSSKTLTKLINIMRNDMPELDLTIQSKDHKITDDELNKIMSAWVSGGAIYEISKKYFGGTDTDNVTNCTRTIYKKIVNNVTWGLSAAEKIMKRTSNIPAMVYYGVNSDQAILMSMNGVPRRIADKLGSTYFEEHSSLYDARSRDVLKWLQNQKTSVWDKASDGMLTGQEYKKIWQINEGL